MNDMNGNDALGAVAELAASQHGAFTRNQAATNSISSRQLRRARDRGRLRQPLSDVYVFASHPETFRQRCCIASLAGAVMSHRCSAILHNFDGFPERTNSRVEVCFERRRERTLPGAIVHTWSDTDKLDITTIDGIRCTSIARTLFQLGAVCDRDHVEIALDSALRSGAPPAWIEETALRLVRPGPTGGNVLLTLMYDPSRRGALSESALEHLVKRVLAVPGLPAPVRQHRVQLAGGERRLDLAFPDVMLGIEGHSRRHHFGPRAANDDATRDLELAAAGWEVIYVTWSMASDPATLIPLIERTYRTRERMLRSTG